MANADRPCEVCHGLRFLALGRKGGQTFVRCRECGLERIDPPPTDEDLAEIYGQHYYDAWGLGTDGAAVETQKRGTFARVLDAAALARGARVLDCGAATGFLMMEAADRGLEPYGVELSDFGAESIARRFGAERVFRGQLEEARFPGLPERHAFHAIFMCDYLEHVRDPEAVLRRARELLAPGGRVIITTPRTGSWSHRAMRLGWTHYKTEHLYYFGDHSLRLLLERLGFAEVKLRPLVKSMTLAYLAQQLATYRHPVLTPLAQAMARLVPARLGRRTFPVLMGEVVAVASSS